MAAAAEVMQSMSRPKNGAERRLLNNVLRRAVSLEILRQYNPRMRMLDEELLGTDRVLQRWAISVGSGMPVEDWDETPVSRLSPLDDVSAIIVDQIILRSSPRTKALIIPWYRGTGSVTTLMERLGVDRNGLHLEWRAALFYLRSKFQESGHKELIRMLDVQVHV